MGADRLRAVLRFELIRMLRDRHTWIALSVFAVTLIYGAWSYWQSLPPRAQNSRMFGEAFLLAMVIGWHSGIARDRIFKFDAYLVANFVEPRTAFLAKVATALAFVAMLGFAAFLLATAASLGDLGYAAHYTVLFVLAAIVALPGIILLELALNARYPVPVLVIIFFVVLGIYSRGGDVQPLIRALGMHGHIEVVPAIVRTAAALLLTVACYPIYRLRLGKRRLASEAGSL